MKKIFFSVLVVIIVIGALSAVSFASDDKEAKEIIVEIIITPESSLAAHEIYEGVTVVVSGHKAVCIAYVEGQENFAKYRVKIPVSCK